MSSNKSSSRNNTVRFTTVACLSVLFLSFSAIGSSAASGSFIDSVREFFGLAIYDDAPAAAFTAGNLVVCRIGDGSTALSGASAPIFLDEYTPGGSFVQSIALPTSDSGANKAITSAGSSTTECQLTRSTNGSYLIVTGYDTGTATPAVAATTGATVARVIGRIDSSGVIDTSTTTTSFSTQNIRAAASDNGTNLWASGSGTGVVYNTLGGSGAGTLVESTVTNIRSTNIFAGQLYISNSSATTAQIGAVGTGLPTAISQPVTNIPGFPTNSSTNEFFFADLDGGVAGVDTLYTADDGSGTGSSCHRG